MPKRSDACKTNRPLQTAITKVVKYFDTTRKIIRLGFVFVLVGVISILLAIKFQQDLQLQYFEGSKILSDIGTAFITLGVVGVIVSFKDWTDYFKERLSEIVISRSYLDKLTKDELIGLQISTLKSYYGVDNIDREGSFLYYFQNKMQSYIGEPYREDISTTINVTKLDNKNFLVTDTITYKCRMVGESIQDDIKWGADKGEYSEIRSVEFFVKCPPQYHENCKVKCDGVECGDFYKFKQNELEGLGNQYDGFKAKLSKFANMDHLFVKIVSVYVTSAEKISTWQMAHPTKKFNFTAHFPDTISIHVEKFGMDDYTCNEVKAVGVYNLRSDDWVLPKNGIAFNFYPTDTEK